MAKGRANPCQVVPNRQGLTGPWVPPRFARAARARTPRPPLLRHQAYHGPWRCCPVSPATGGRGRSPRPAPSAPPGRSPQTRRRGGSAHAARNGPPGSPSSRGRARGAQPWDGRFPSHHREDQHPGTPRPRGRRRPLPRATPPAAAPGLWQCKSGCDREPQAVPKQPKLRPHPARGADHRHRRGPQASRRHIRVVRGPAGKRSSVPSWDEIMFGELASAGLLPPLHTAGRAEAEHFIYPGSLEPER